MQEEIYVFLFSFERLRSLYDNDLNKWYTKCTQSM